MKNTGKLSKDEIRTIKTTKEHLSKKEELKLAVDVQRVLEDQIAASTALLATMTGGVVYLNMVRRFFPLAGVQSIRFRLQKLTRLGFLRPMTEEEIQGEREEVDSPIWKLERFLVDHLKYLGDYHLKKIRYYVLTEKGKVFFGLQPELFSSLEIGLQEKLQSFKKIIAQGLRRVSRVVRRRVEAFKTRIFREMFPHFDHYANEFDFQPEEFQSLTKRYARVLTAMGSATTPRELHREMRIFIGEMYRELGGRIYSKRAWEDLWKKKLDQALLRRKGVIT